jgi:lysophospholipase L1-like esterase
MQALKFILVNSLAVMALLTGLELASRVFEPVDFPDPLVTTWRDDWKGTRQFDPLLFWRMRPNTVIDGDRSTNSLGLRGSEVLGKQPDEFRILSLGESTTFAPALANSESYSSLVEGRLAQLDSRQVRVINAGVPGYSLFQGYTYLLYFGLALEPDMVVTYFGFNDFLPITFRSQRDALSARSPRALTDRQLFELRTRRLSRIGFWLLERSNLARARVFRDREETQPVESLSDHPRVPEQDRRWILAELQHLASEIGFRLVVIIPWYLEFDEHILLLRDLKASSETVTVIDLPKRLDHLSVDRARYFRDQVHPNRQGHQIMAEEIASALVSSRHGS